jgi:alkylhydroperoxidase/carboxymuconolactone decarboxylase family protein YurZ
LGATREEIRETILLTLTIVGLKDINTALANILETYDKV